MNCEIEKLKKVLAYDGETGALTWLVSVAKNVKAGAKAGCLKENGYIQIGFAGRVYTAHRLAFALTYGEWPPEMVDHINGVRSDNRMQNLRMVSCSENMQNIKRAPKSSSTGLLGATPNRNRTGFRSFIRAGGEKRYLGVYATAEEASQAYLAAKRVLHPAGTL